MVLHKVSDNGRSNQRRNVDRMLFTIDFIVSDLMILASIFAVIVDVHKLSDILGRDWKLADVMDVIV